MIADGAKIEDGAVVEGPCFIDEGTVVRPGARVEPYSVIGQRVPHRGVGGRARLDRLERLAGSAARRWSISAIVGRNAHVGRNATVSPGRILGDKSVLTDFTQA